jgi:hypothetical protein
MTTRPVNTLSLILAFAATSFAAPPPAKPKPKAKVDYSKQMKTSADRILQYRQERAQLMQEIQGHLGDFAKEGIGVGAKGPIRAEDFEKLMAAVEASLATGKAVAESDVAELQGPAVIALQQMASTLVPQLKLAFASVQGGFALTQALDNAKKISRLRQNEAGELEALQNMQELQAKSTTSSRLKRNTTKATSATTIPDIEDEALWQHEAEADAQRRRQEVARSSAEAANRSMLKDLNAQYEETLLREREARATYGRISAEANRVYDASFKACQDAKNRDSSFPVIDCIDRAGAVFENAWKPALAVVGAVLDEQRLLENQMKVIRGY